MINLEIVESDLKELNQNQLDDFLGEYPATWEVLNEQTKFAWVKIDNVKRYALLYEFDEYKLLVTGAFAVQPNRLFLKEVFPHIEALAKQLGCKEVQYYTERNGMIKAGQKNGYKAQAVKMSKKL